MRVRLVGRHAKDLEPIARGCGLEVVGEGEPRPDAIVTYGGDGTMIGTERTWPGVPKLGLRDNRSCVKCDFHPDEAVLGRLAANELERTELPKLEARTGSRRFLGMNDVLIRNADLRSAVRFVVYVNDEAVTDEIIGDGLVVSTPFGSSAYFRSITYVTFRQGIGVAFNNCTDFVSHYVLAATDVVRIHVNRGPAQLTTDNDEDLAMLVDDDDVLVRDSGERAVLLGVDALRCSRCRYAHAPRRRF